MNKNNEQSQTKPLADISEATKEAFLLFQEMQTMYDANTLKLGAKLLEKPKPYVTQRKNDAGSTEEERTYYRLTFGFTGGTITEAVDSELYHSANIGDKFLLEGYIKSTAQNKTFEDKTTAETRSYATTTLNPAITKITRFDLASLMMTSAFPN